MARECGVAFLGSVPVDTEFGSLVEGMTDTAEDQGGVEKELVERYRACRLCPIFDGFARKIVQAS
jgi:hypothetical protein